MAATLEDRVTQLEIQLAHAQHTCDQLNDVITKMALESGERDRQFQRLTDQLKELKNRLDAGDLPEDEKPPHY